MAERYIHEIGKGHGRVKSAESEHVERNPVLTPKKKSIAGKMKVAKRVSEISKNIAEKTKKYGSESQEAHPYSKF